MRSGLHHARRFACNVTVIPCHQILVLLVLQDWAVLYRDHGLCTFLAVALISNDVVVGVMMLASKQVSAFQQTW